MTKFRQSKCTQLHRHTPGAPKPLSLCYLHAPKRNCRSEQLLKYNREINSLRSANKLTVQSTETQTNTIKSNHIKVKVFQRTISIAVPEIVQGVATKLLTQFFHKSTHHDGHPHQFRSPNRLIILSELSFFSRFLQMKPI